MTELLRDVELHFAYRARQEQKEILLSGADDIWRSCDREWILEAMDNLVKNALDHTGKGGCIQMEWSQLLSAVQILIKDNGSGEFTRRICTIFSSGFIAAAFLRILRELVWGCLLQKQL